MVEQTQQGKYDVVVVGSGPGGYVAAIRASQLGLRSAVIEREELGGVCLNWGCIPSKALLHNAEVVTLFQEAATYGVTVDGIKADYGKAIDRAHKSITLQVRGVQYLMKKNKIDVIKGNARLVAPGRLSVKSSEGDREVEATNIIIATGSRVRMLPGLEADGKYVITAKEIWTLKDAPASLIILGAGPIGLEFATVFLAYGTKVTVVEMMPRVLPLEDEEASKILTNVMRKRGLEILTSTKVESVTRQGNKVKVKISPVGESKEAPRELEADRVLSAIGFAPNSDNLGLESVGVKLDRRGFIEIDDEMRTNIPGIYAIGDVTGKLPLAHVASAQGIVAAEVIAGHPTIKLDYEAMPRCTYTSPQVASIGLTEQQALERGLKIKVGKSPVKPNGKALALNETEGHIKIIADEKYGDIIGAHLVGPSVTELIGEFSLAKLVEGTTEELARTVHPDPTLSEIITEAAEATNGRSING